MRSSFGRILRWKCGFCRRAGPCFLRALGEGRSLDEAADLALAERSDFNLAFNLAGLIGWGLIREVIVAR